MPSPTPFSGSIVSEKDYISCQPVMLRSHLEIINEITVSYPLIIYSQFANQINDMIFTNLNSFIIHNSERLSDVKYTVTQNNKGFLSLFFYGKCEGTNLMLYLPQNYDTLTGAAISIDRLFVNEGWQNAIADSVLSSAENAGSTLLSNTISIDSSRLFYLTDKSIVIVYRLYEIATYSDVLRFTISYDRLADYINTTGYIARILG